MEIKQHAEQRLLGKFNLQEGRGDIKDHKLHGQPRKDLNVEKTLLYITRYAQTEQNFYYYHISGNVTHKIQLQNDERKLKESKQFINVCPEVMIK
jgi:hypothetical protein